MTTNTETTDTEWHPGTTCHPERCPEHYWWPTTPPEVDVYGATQTYEDQARWDIQWHQDRCGDLYEAAGLTRSGCAGPVGVFADRLSPDRQWRVRIVAQGSRDDRDALTVAEASVVAADIAAVVAAVEATPVECPVWPLPYVAAADGHVHADDQECEACPWTISPAGVEGHR